MDTILIVMILLVPALIVCGQFLFRANCPDCGESLPGLVSPFKKSRRMWLSGGYLCTNCGCETNIAGQKVTSDTPAALFPKLQIAVLTVLLLLGVGLGAYPLVSAAARQPAMAAPVVVERQVLPAN